ncbi:MAG: hypothetical protein ACREPA_03550 [Candidatus Dormibacteraceae bacterium]
MEVAGLPKAGRSARSRSRLALGPVVAVAIAAAVFADGPARAHPRPLATRPAPMPAAGPVPAPGRLLAAQMAAREQSSRLHGWLWQTLLPAHRLVVFYGDPASPEMGVLGASPPAVMLARLRQQATVYEGLDPRHPVVPALDIVDPVAQPYPMRDGTYAAAIPDAQIGALVDLARRQHVLLFFDLQIGRGSVAAQVDRLWPWIIQPGIDIALDPEFDMAPGEVPGVEFGRMMAAEINAVSDRLSTLVATGNLPPKVLIVHQFRPDVLPDRSRIEVLPGVQLVICADGVGPPGPKAGGYEMYDDPSVQYPGIKLFYRSDHPLMTERQVVSLAPSPLLIMYQ